MVLLSKADLLAPGDRRKMTDYALEQLGRELGAGIAVHPVSTVGADESLLTAWFEYDLAPLLDRHRGLAEASLRRKIAGLRESVIATLETVLAQSGAACLMMVSGSIDPRRNSFWTRLTRRFASLLGVPWIGGRTGGP